MRNQLKGQAKKNESFILNIDDSSGEGTHWVALYINDGKCYYFDSYGFQPPIEVEEYTSRLKDRYYNSFKIQTPTEVICGHYCIYVIYSLQRGLLFNDVLHELFKRNN